VGQSNQLLVGQTSYIGPKGQCTFGSEKEVKSFGVTNAKQQQQQQKNNNKKIIGRNHQEILYYYVEYCYIVLALH